MKISDLEEIGRRIEEGDWIGNLPGLAGLRLKVRGLRNSQFERLQAKLVRKAAPGGRRLTIDESESITAECLLQTVLLDWDGLTGENDEPVAFSEDMARRLLTDPHFAAFKGAVIYAADVVGDLNRTD